MTYVRVTDLPATWADYEPPRGLLAAAAHGLIIFVAGPTDEGIRIVELWSSRDAWVQARFTTAAVHGVTPTVRELNAPFAVGGVS